MIDYQKHITINPNVRFGRPCIVGTRISVYDVLNWMANGLSVEQIIADFPECTSEQVNACLAYTADKERKVRIA